MKLRQLSALQYALAGSILLHAALLTLRVADQQTFNRLFQDTPLEVILVNARSAEKPDRASALAQASLAGGGESASGRAASPLAPALIDVAAQDAEQNQQQSLRDMQQRQNQMLAQVKAIMAAMPPADAKVENPSAEQLERAQKRRQLIKLLAEIERRILEENARPRKRYISPATREVVFAVYYDHLRRAIEDTGTRNFPQINGEKLYGELTMEVTVNDRGEVLATKIGQSSKIPALDTRAQAIARAAGPFGKFNPAMRRQADQIIVLSRFKFTRDDALETRLSNQ